MEITPAKSRSKLSFDNIGFILGLIWIPVFFLLFLKDADSARGVQPGGLLGRGVIVPVIAVLCVATFLLIVGGLVTAMLNLFNRDR